MRIAPAITLNPEQRATLGQRARSRKKVSRWHQRFLTLGTAGLERDAPRPGRAPKIGASLVRRVVNLTTRQKPLRATHWSTRRMAEQWASARPACGVLAQSRAETASHRELQDQPRSRVHKK